MRAYAGSLRLPTSSGENLRSSHRTAKLTSRQNVVVLLPMVPTRSSVASVRVVPRAIPGLHFQLQGATWDGASLNFSSGAEVFCF